MSWLRALVGLGLHTKHLPLLQLNLMLLLHAAAAGSVSTIRKLNRFEIKYLVAITVTILLFHKRLL